jgi:hypothetical protein
MKNMKKIILIALILVSITYAAQAQPGKDGYDDEPVDAPIDRDVIYLVAVGLAYGSKMIFFYKNKSKINN